jgi:DNA-binding response OmpR family regulator
MARPRILIVEDEPDIAEAMGDRLSANGYEVQIVGSATACYDAVAANRPDLVLLDIQMPEISGMEALVQLKTADPDLPVLMVSASTVRVAAGEARAKGAEGFLLKPFEPQELLSWVADILARSRGQAGSP